MLSDRFGEPEQARHALVLIHLLADTGLTGAFEDFFTHRLDFHRGGVRLRGAPQAAEPAHPSQRGAQPEAMGRREEDARARGGLSPTIARREPRWASPPARRTGSSSPTRGRFTVSNPARLPSPHRLHPSLTPPSGVAREFSGREAGKSSSASQRSVDLLAYTRMQFPAPSPPLDICDQRTRPADSGVRSFRGLGSQDAGQHAIKHGGIAELLGSSQIGREPPPGAATGRREELHGDSPSNHLLLVSRPGLLQEPLFEVLVRPDFFGDRGGLERQEEILPLTRPVHEPIFLLHWPRHTGPTDCRSKRGLPTQPTRPLHASTAHTKARMSPSYWRAGSGAQLPPGGSRGGHSAGGVDGHVTATLVHEHVPTTVLGRGVNLRPASSVDRELLSRAASLRVWLELSSPWLRGHLLGNGLLGGGLLALRRRTRSGVPA